MLVQGAIYYFKGTEAAAAALGTIPLAGSTFATLKSDFVFEVVTPRPNPNPNPDPNPNPNPHPNPDPNPNPHQVQTPNQAVQVT